MFTIATFAVAAAKPADSITEGLKRVYAAYSNQIDSIDGDYLYWKDGTKMKYDDGENKSFSGKLKDASLKDQMSQEYPQGDDYETPIEINNDPGRIRNTEFFKKIYGETEEEVRENLNTIEWFGEKLRVNTINGIDEKLKKIRAELSELPDRYRKYYINTGKAFNWRKIAGTDRLSAHSFGIAIDLNVKHGDYWRWNQPNENGVYEYKNRMPYEIVEIFEKHGFIWGGKWYHFDTMHFEYRPELLIDLSD